MVEIAEMFQMPEAVDKHFSNRGYYGSVNHNVKATYVLYLGGFIGNPATLHVLPPVESSKRYVDMMGGADAVVKSPKKYYEKGENRWVAEVVNHVVFNDPGVLVHQLSGARTRIRTSLVSTQWRMWQNVSPTSSRVRVTALESRSALKFDYRQMSAVLEAAAPAAQRSRAVGGWTRGCCV